jgi:hypothetical protein
MQIIPGINHFSIIASSIPILNHLPNQLEKKRIKAMKTILIEELIRKEEEAIAVFSSGLLLVLTYLICAFFSKFVLVASKMPVSVRNSAQEPS